MSQEGRSGLTKQELLQIAQDIGSTSSLDVLGKIIDRPLAEFKAGKMTYEEYLQVVWTIAIEVSSTILAISGAADSEPAEMFQHFMGVFHDNIDQATCNKWELIKRHYDEAPSVH